MADRITSSTRRQFAFSVIDAGSASTLAEFGHIVFDIAGKAGYAQNGAALVAFSESLAQELERFLNIVITDTSEAEPSSDDDVIFSRVEKYARNPALFAFSKKLPQGDGSGGMFFAPAMRVPNAFVYAKNVGWFFSNQNLQTLGERPTIVLFDMHMARLIGHLIQDCVRDAADNVGGREFVNTTKFIIESASDVFKVLGTTLVNITSHERF